MSNPTTLDEYLERYAPLLSRRCSESLTPLHRPSDPPDPLLQQLLRPCFEAQAHVATAMAKALVKQKTILAVCEMGTGKSIMALAAIHVHAKSQPYRALVFCPGQLVQKWEREIRSTIPNATVTQLARWSDVVKLRRVRCPRQSGEGSVGPSFYVIGRDTAKRGPGWRAVYRKVQASGTIGHAARDTDMAGRCDGHVCLRCTKPIDNEDGQLIAVERLEVKKHFCRHCHEPLWTWIPKPRKWAPATFIHKKLKGFFDYLVADEIQEEKSATTAQANALGSLAASCRRCIALTGTIVGGYADHLRPLLFRLASNSIVAEGFRWEDALRFTEAYGRIDTIIRDKESFGVENRQSRGSTTKTKVCRPGIMPTLFGNHLMDKCVFLRLDEVAASLPDYAETIVPIPLEGQLRTCYQKLERDMTSACKQLAVRKNMQLLGAMLNSTLYYADAPFDWGPLGYHEYGEGGGKGAFITVHVPTNLPKQSIYPKEQALLDLCLAEKRAGRQTWVYLQLVEKHGLLARLEGLLAKAGLTVKVLRATVPPPKREPWIQKNAPGTDVILSHPRLVQTGLDFFGPGYCFPMLVWYETGYDLFSLRQASRRAWRIGQDKPCKVVYLYYAETMQTRAMALMGNKLAASEAIDGKFSTEGLVACSDDDGMQMAMAKALIERIDEDPTRTWAKIGATKGGDVQCQRSQRADQSTTATDVASLIPALVRDSAAAVSGSVLELPKSRTPARAAAAYYSDEQMAAIRLKLAAIKARVRQTV